MLGCARVQLMVLGFAELLCVRVHVRGPAPSPPRPGLTAVRAAVAALEFEVGWLYSQTHDGAFSRFYLVSGCCAVAQCRLLFSIRQLTDSAISS